MERKLVSDQVEAWAFDNRRAIPYNMEKYRVIMREYHLSRGETAQASKFDLKKRTHPEMLLCGSLVSIDPPIGYKRVSGDVLIPQEGGDPKVVGHQFFVDESSHAILCLTTGQFCEPYNETLLPGERIAKLKAVAPDLFVTTAGVCALSARREEIATHLGLIYRGGPFLA